jgi:small subunit ribosomal protein S4
MGRYTGSVCRLCRRETIKLFLKGTKCETDKCPIERRAYPPGDHGKDRRPKKDSDYGIQLREKQKAKRIYGARERQFRNYFEGASRQTGVTGQYLLQALEKRLDNVVYRLGFAPSRAAARQLVRHRHIMVDNRPVDIPSYQVSANSVVAVRPASRNLSVVQDALEKRGGRTLPGWLELNVEGMSGRVRMMPSREEIQIPVQEQLIVELYSK